MHRRDGLRTLLACSVSALGLASHPLRLAAQASAQPGAEAERWLREGGVVAIFRHALAPGVSDPSEMRLGDCSTQRNLNEEGRDQSRRIGAWFEQRGLRPQAVRSSQWCRCQDTAQLAFGHREDWAPLNSFFRNRQDGPRQVAQMRAALMAIRAGQFEVWVTHQVNISGLTDRFASSGEGYIVRAAPDGTVLTLATLQA